MKKLIASMSALALAGVLVMSSCKKPADAGFTATPASVKVGELVTFTDNETERANASIVWEFGDGSTGTGRISTHAYRKAGTYSAYQTVTNNKNAEKGKGTEVSSAATVITVTGPAASFTAGASSVGVNVPVTFTNTSTGADVYRWSWTSSNGDSWDGGQTNVKDLTKTFSNSGTYTIYLWADTKDSYGVSYSVATPVTITVTGGTASTANAAAKALLYGKWTFVSDIVDVVGSTGATGCYGTDASTPITTHNTIEFHDNGTVNMIEKTGNQTTGTGTGGTAGTWSMTADAQYLTTSVLIAGFVSPTGTFHIESLTANSLVLKVQEICTTNTAASRTKTVTLSK